MANSELTKIGEIIQHIHVCGCGSPNSVLALILEVLELVNTEECSTSEDYEARWQRIDAWRKTMPEPVAEFVLHVIDGWGLCEHGSCIPGWLTDDGLALMRFLKETECNRERWSDADIAWSKMQYAASKGKVR